MEKNMENVSNEFAWLKHIIMTHKHECSALEKMASLPELSGFKKIILNDENPTLNVQQNYALWVSRKLIYRPSVENYSFMMADDYINCAQYFRALSQHIFDIIFFQVAQMQWMRICAHAPSFISKFLFRYRFISRI